MAWVVGFWVVLALLAAAGGLCAWLMSEKRGLRAEAERLTGELRRSEEARAKGAQESADLVRRLERVEADREAAERRFEEAQKQARDTFQSVAGDALARASEQFIHLAKKTFEGEQKDATAQLEQRKQAIDSMLVPIRETLAKYQEAMGQVEKARTEAYGSLTAQLGSLVEDQRRLRDETANLVKALRRPEVRGRWGEMQLRRVAELAGMIRYCDFFEQAAVGVAAVDGDGRSGGGGLRPDMVVRLPSERTIVIDAKTPIDAFIDATECTEDETRAECLERHVRQIESQIGKLAAKAYQDQFERSPDFVVLFIPGESFLHAAVQVRPTLIESAMAQGILIASPTTLISLLKAVALGWREEQVAENAKRISELGQELHERIGTATGYINNVGKHLDNAVKAYNQFVGSWESRVLVSARRFKELGADSSKELPADGQLQQVEQMPRETRSAEATELPV